jgi:hypothetical protein
MTVYEENFLSIRKLYPRVSERVPSNRMAVANPASPTEREYRDLLSEANLNFFHREYSIALQNYQALRQKILEQSHPEMPRMPGVAFYLDLDWTKAKVAQLMEFSRREVLLRAKGPRVTLPLADERVINPGELPVNQAIGKWSGVGVDAKRVLQGDLLDQRGRARDLVAAGNWQEAARQYELAGKAAADNGNLELAAQLANESATVLATYAGGDGRRAALEQAMSGFTRAEQLYARAGNLEAVDVVRANRANLQSETAAPAGRRPPAEPSGPVPQSPSAAAAVNRSVRLAGGGQIDVHDLLRPDAVLPRTGLQAGAIQPQATRIYMLADANGWKTATTAIEQAVAAAPTAKTVGLFFPAGVRTLSLDANVFAGDLTDTIYAKRISATVLEDLNFYEVVEINFVAYFVHLYYFVLPIAIGDSYAAMGMYDKALVEYRSVLAYPFLNLGIEAPYVWLKMADAYLQWGNTLYRREQRVAARQKYESIVRADLSLPPTSELYKGKFAPLQAAATEVINELRQQPHAPTNPKMAAVITQAAMRLKYLAHDFNYFGIGADYAPVFRFKYLQSVATYMAESAIEVERTFIGYRSTAENQKIERMQLESAVDVNKAALAVENKRMEDAALEVEAARRTREYAEVRKQNADDALAEWDTKGRELTSMNAALSWASAAANDQDIRYTGVRYDGASHDYEGTVEEFFDTVGERREWMDWELQRNRIVRQQAETAAEVAMAQTREAQAQVRYEVQGLNVVLQQKRLEASQEVLEYAENRLFDEDLWFQLAAQLQDLARSYLDAAIYAALVMERAYDLEFDRRLNRIRTDYMLGVPAGLLGGDHLKRDIVSFTSDYLENAQKKNPVRLALSLREEVPSGFATFVETGILPFRTDLEIFDRRYPGTYRRKIKKIELFVEGLVPLEGASGFLTNNGISAEWRQVGGVWTKFTRVMPVERMVLSSYQFRRDIAVFQPSEEMLGQFENMGPQCEWTLDLPRSGNNLDYNAIGDIKFVIYFDADFHDGLAAHVKALYPATGARATVLSSRFQYPDEYFRLDAERSVNFAIGTSVFACNIEAPRLTAFGVRLLPSAGATVAGLALTVTRVSDGTSVAVTTDGQGKASGAVGTMAPFGAWKDASPIDEWRVAIGDGVTSGDIADVQLFYSYAFNYRADGSLA